MKKYSGNKSKVWELVELPMKKRQCPVNRCCISKETMFTKPDQLFVVSNRSQELITLRPMLLSSVCHHLALCIILQKGLKLYALDVKTDFLNDKLEEIIFMEETMGYSDNSGRVCKLLKSLYVLKQTPKQWFQR